MASPKKSGAKAAPAKSVPPVKPIPQAEPVAEIVETAPVVEAAPVEPEPVIEAAAPIAVEPAATLAEPETAEFVAAPEVPAPPAPLVEAAPVAEIAPEPAPVETSVARTDIFSVVKIPDALNMMDVSKIIEAPMASITDAQDKARSLAAASLMETRTRFSQLKTAADETTSALETSYATVRNGALEFNAKALEALKATAEANFEFMKSVFAVKSPSEYVTLHTEFARKQMEAAQAHGKAFGELAQKIATETVEPIKAQVSKTFNLSL